MSLVPVVTSPDPVMDYGHKANRLRLSYDINEL